MSNQANIQEMTLEEVMGDRFGRYSKYIIQDRALPDIRDGLKPVQRRILYAMHADGNTYDKGFRKSAKTVGNVIANYHPHGDTSVYDAMVRLSQDWKLRDILVEMHGNNGSMDGDSAAAMRYTEARLSKLSDEMLKDIDKETVDFILNFDDTNEEPTVLPAKFPNLLVNGSTGISAGYATDIPPHNLSEVIEATVHLLEHPQAEVIDLMRYIKGPDFPTGAIIQGKQGLLEAYKTGRGKIVVRSLYTIESIRGGREQIVINEIPFDINKANLVKKMDEIRLSKKIDGISEVRDESDRNGLQIVVELKKDANAQAIMNYLLKNTDLQVTYNFNMVAIHNRRPEQVGLITILSAYIEHQKDVIKRRTQFNLHKAKKRLHIVEGLIKALSILDEVIATIRNSLDRKDAQQNLMDAFDFTLQQAEAIVSLQLYRLTNTDITALQNEKLDLNEEVASLTLVLEQEKVLINVLKQELLAVKKSFGTQRLTKIQDAIEEITINENELINEEDVYVVVSKGGYLKRVSPRSYNASQTEMTGLREKDEVLFVQQATTKQTLIAITSLGNYAYLPIHEMNEYKWKDLGGHISQKISMEESETLIGAFVIDDYAPNSTLLLSTSDGMIKRVLLSQLQSFRSYKTKTATAMNLKNMDARVICVHVIESISSDTTVLLITHRGFGLRYAINEIPEVGLKASGVKSINLKADDFVVSALVINDFETKEQLFLVTQRGNVKRMWVNEMDVMARAKRGLMVLKELKTQPHRIIFADLVRSNTHYELVTALNKTISVDPMQINLSDRYSNGTSISSSSAILEVLTIK